MKIIADSSSTRTEWALVDGMEIVLQATTAGLNPYFQTRREISHIIRLELPEKFFRRRWDHIYFYGPGCNSPEKNKVVEMSIVAQFKSPVSVESDLLGAARGLLGNEAGLACILGTGSNSCFYDGEKIVKTVRPLGYVLGDEGSNSYLGKVLVSNILKGLAPKELAEAFFDTFQTSPAEVLDKVYTEPMANRTLSEYSLILADHLSNEYVQDLIYNGFMDYFRRNISSYDYKSVPMSFVGSTAVIYSEILSRVASDFGASIRHICRSSLPGLIKYHSTLKTS